MAVKTWISVSSPDYSVSGNWSPSGVPIAGDVVRIPAATAAITAGLNQSAVALDGFYVEAGYSSAIGTISANLQVTVSSGNPFVFAGQGVAYIDLGSSAISPIVNNTATVATGLGFGLYLTGSALVALYVNRGSVGLAARGGNTSTCPIINCQFTTNQIGDVTLYLGAGCTLTTVNQTGGTLSINSAATTITAQAGTTFISGVGAVTTFTNNGATCYPTTSGTITTCNANAGITDFTRSQVARTVTTLNSAGNDAVIIYDPAFVTVTNPLTPPNTPVQIRVEAL